MARWKLASRSVLVTVEAVCAGVLPVSQTACGVASIAAIKQGVFELELFEQLNGLLDGATGGLRDEEASISGEGSVCWGLRGCLDCKESTR